MLWRFLRFRAAKKQSQFKPNQACPERSRMEPILFSPQIYLGVENPI